MQVINSKTFAMLSNGKKLWVSSAKVDVYGSVTHARSTIALAHAVADAVLLVVL